MELLFVDFGNVETTSPESIRWLSPDTAKVPVQAANCSLFGIEPLEVMVILNPLRVKNQTAKLMSAKSQKKSVSSKFYHSKNFKTRVQIV